MQTLELLLMVDRLPRSKVGSTNELNLLSATSRDPWLAGVGAGYVGVYLYWTAGLVSAQ